MKRITVLTPSYNRAYILGNLYRSLLRQSFKDFEWLIIDDGSEDSTSELVRKWRQESTDLDIRYYKVTNGGKHRAINLGLDLAEGEILFVVDSDDYLTIDALEKINAWFLEIADMPSMAGIVANRGFSEDKTCNPIFTEDYLDISFLDALAYKENGKLVLTGEKAIAFYRDIQRNYRYPEFEGENFMTEAVVYHRMAHDGYKMRYYNDIIWIFKYLDDGLTSKGSDIYVQNPRGYGLFLKERAEYLRVSLRHTIRMWYSFYCEMSFCQKEYRLSKRQIADYIGAPVCMMYFAEIAHILISSFKRKR